MELPDADLKIGAAGKWQHFQKDFFYRLVGFIDMKENKRNYLTEGVAIAVLTLIGYVAAYQFEVGFCSFWQIPNYFIDISLLTVITSNIAFIYFLLAIMFCILPIELIFKKILKHRSKLRILVIIDIVCVFILISTFRGYGTDSKFYIYLIGIILLNIFMFTNWYVSVKKHTEEKKSDGESVQEDKEPEVPSGFFELLLSILGMRFFLVLMLLPMSISIASAAGSFHAKQPKNYLVIKPEGLVLIKRYGETYILKNIDLETNIMGGEILIWRGEDIAKYQLTPIKLKNVSISENPTMNKKPTKKPTETKKAPSESR